MVRFQAVARNAEDHRAEFFELPVQVAELRAFDGASGSVVLGIEIQNDWMALLRRKLEIAAGAGRGEVY